MVISFFIFLWSCALPKEVNDTRFLLFVSHALSSSITSTLNTLSCIHLYRPCISACDHPDRCVSLCTYLLCSFHTGSSVSHQCCRLAGDGRISYIDRNKKRIPSWFIFQRSDNVMLRCRSSHLIQVPCFPSSAARDLLAPSTSLLTLSWTMILLSILSIMVHCWKCDTVTLLSSTRVVNNILQLKLALLLLL